MKKLIALVLASVLCIGLCACGTEPGSQFVGTYESKFTRIELSDNGSKDIYCKETLILNSGGTGTYKAVATNSGKYYQSGYVVEEGTVQWTCEDDYITITYSGLRYIISYGNITTQPDDRTVTYEKKAGTLHNASSGNLEYTKVG